MGGMFAVDSVGRSGGVVVFWEANLDVSLVGFSRNHVDIRVCMDGVGEWRVTGFYGEPSRSRRRESWELLRWLADKSSLPWLCIGDFNDMLASYEKRGGNPQPHWILDGFAEALHDCRLVDIGLEGYQFTWCRGRGSANCVEEKLDRVVANDAWIELFKEVRVVNLPWLTSDHTPIFVQPFKGRRGAGERRFRFENCWIGEPGCREAIMSGWGRRGDADILSKIGRSSKALWEWGGPKLRELLRKVRVARERVAVRGGRDDGEIREGYYRALEAYETYWKQRAKLFWLAGGDANTKYFHASASNRRRNNKIEQLKDSRGVWRKAGEGLEDVVTDYFSQLFMAQGVDSEEVCGLIGRRLTVEQNQELVEQFSVEEVRSTLNSMHGDKALGPDGLNPAFYREYWDIVGAYVVDACMDILNKGVMPETLNDTHVVLIPKKSNPETMGELRPISLCNILYKIVAKMLANRLKRVLEVCISDSQSAFLSGRLISDNIGVATEILHCMKRRSQGSNGVVALKLDMAKAYDRVEWRFLFDIMAAMGFCEKWIGWMRMCITTVRYRVILGSGLSDVVVPGRGLRQGDPLSPYLFIICAEGLSMLLKQSERRGRIHGCRVARSAPSVSHLFFADDSFLFCKAKLEEVRVIKEILHVYEKASGQLVNFAKSSVMFSANVASHTREDICTELGVREEEGVNTYLGLPVTIGRNKSDVFRFVKDRVAQRLNGWGRKFLSRAGKEILLKTVAQALPNYAMSIFLIPIDTCAAIERMMNSFWWGSSSPKARGLHWCSWDNLCAPKKAGGLGVRKLREFNIALLGKQGWRLMTRPHSLLARILKARYFPKCSFLDAPVGSNPSYLWRSVRAAQALLKSESYMRIGNGQNTRIFKDPWLVGLVNGGARSVPPEGWEEARVSCLIDPERRRWNWDLIDQLFLVEERKEVERIVLSSRGVGDVWTWKYEKKGSYSVKSAYKALRSTVAEEGVDAVEAEMWRKLWATRCPAKAKHFVWRACKRYVPSAWRLFEKRVEVDVMCAACGRTAETLEHALFECEKAQECWRRSSCRVRWEVGWSVKRWWLEVVRKEAQQVWGEAAVLCWQLWWGRNDLLWNGKEWSAERVIQASRVLFEGWLAAQQERSEGLQEGVERKWVVPDRGVVKINSDAAVFEGEGRTGIGWVARDHIGACLGAGCKLANAVMDVREAECWALREALSWAAGKGWSRVVMEADVLDVMRSLQRREVEDSGGNMLLMDCLTFVDKFNNVVFSYVNRSANRVAHELARLPHSVSEGCLFSPSSIPSSIKDCILSDLN